MGRNRKYALNENYFNVIDSKNKAYLIGFIYADGGVYNRYLSFNLSKKDIEILDFIASELNYSGKIHKNRQNAYISLTVCSKKIVDDLNKYGIIENKTYRSKQLPLVPEKYINEMIRGFFDGDGSIYKDKKRKEYTVNFSSNRHVLNQLKNILSTQKISSCKIRRRYLDNDISCMLDIRGDNNIEKVLWFLYTKNCFCLKRKKKRFDNFLLNRSRRIFLDKEKIKKLYMLGMKQKDIYKKENLSYSSVRSVIQRLRKNKEIV
jgi:intein-encoded DNA endonuclease-like protein